MYRKIVRDRLRLLMTTDGKIIDSGKDMNKELNEYFVSTYTR